MDDHLLYNSISNGNSEALIDEIERRKSVDFVISRGASPLLVAVTENQGKLVELLIEKGASVNSKDFDQKTCLMHAFEIGEMAIVSNLLTAGAEIDAQNYYGQTALMYGAMRGHAEVVKGLIHEGSVLNTTDQEGRTALDHAYRHMDTAQIRVERIGSD